MGKYGKVPPSAKITHCNECGRKFITHACSASFKSCPDCDSENVEFT